jgi:hypothetical protein
VELTLFLLFLQSFSLPLPPHLALFLPTSAASFHRIFIEVAFINVYVKELDENYNL